MYYIFRLEITSDTDYSFIPYETEILPEMDLSIKERITNRIDHTGRLTCCFVKSSSVQESEKEDEREIHVKIVSN